MLFAIPKEYEEKVLCVEKYCTKPELEILLIIAEKQLGDYENMRNILEQSLRTL